MIYAFYMYVTDLRFLYVLFCSHQFVSYHQSRVPYPSRQGEHLIPSNLRPMYNPVSHNGDSEFWITLRSQKRGLWRGGGAAGGGRTPSQR